MLSHQSPRSLVDSPSPENIFGLNQSKWQKDTPNSVENNILLGCIKSGQEYLLF